MSTPPSSRPEVTTPLVPAETAVLAPPPDPAASGPAVRGQREWWRTAVVYQVFLRSFADGDGDGVGDVAGLRSRLPYLAGLGVDTLWINPWYPSPMVDVGYDVADYRDVDPRFGTLADAEAMIEQAHVLGLRVLLDVVPNHTSNAHPWFLDALAGDERARTRYLFRPGRGESGELPPNDWESCFRGPAWTRTRDPAGDDDASRGEWYLHSFAPEQPDLDWSSDQVRAEMEDVLRFWFDRGVDGFRVDVAHGLAKAPGLPDADGADRRTQEHPGWDQDEVHEVYRAWRALADSYDPPRVFVAEAWVARPWRLPLYLRPDELHTAFEFEPLHVTWRARPWRAVVDSALALTAATGAPSAWALTNHDVVRTVTRYGREQPPLRGTNEWERERFGVEDVDLALGRRRARAATAMVAALPGMLYLYLGEELGLEEVEDIPDRRRCDPIHHRSEGVDPGRDGCRVPLPWSGDAPPFGFSPPGAHLAPWLPQPASWAALTVEAQERDPSSTLRFHRELLRRRRDLAADDEPMVWLPSPPDVLAFSRGRVQCWTNLGADPVALPPGEVVLRSAPLDRQDRLPGDATAWVVPPT